MFRLYFYMSQSIHGKSNPLPTKFDLGHICLLDNFQLSA